MWVLPSTHGFFLGIFARMNHPFLDDAFEPKWESLTAEHVVPDITAALERAQVKIDAIGESGNGSGGRLTFENTFLALEAATEPVYTAWGKVNHLDSVNNSPKLREAINTMLPRVSEFSAAIPLNEKLYTALSEAAAMPEVTALTGARKRFVEETLADFREQGAELPPEKKKRLMEVKQQLAAKTQKFSENVLDSTNAFEKVITDESLLAGLPDTARAAALQNARQKGLATDAEPAWRFTLQVPSFLPVQKYLDNADVRKEMFEGFTRVGAEGEYDNTALIWEILELRREQAQLLGKAQFADVVLERRMAKNGAAALGFVENLHDRVLDAFRKDTAELEQFTHDQDGSDGGHLEPWDRYYWSEKLQKARYDLDDEVLRPYFPIGAVIEGLFKLTGTVFGVTVTERTGDAKAQVWHPEVHFYDIHDAESRKHLGSFYADWHPRESKRAGAWMNSLSTGDRSGGSYEPHLGLICGNLTAPVGDQPALLTHREVETIFHEFGHLLHHLLGEVEVKSLNGTEVAWDFVELPSQIMENWTWERESLDLFARHYETGEPIPDDLFERMIRARNYQSATLMMRQLSLGKMDLELHVNYDTHKGSGLDDTLKMLLETYRPPTPTDHPTIVRAFGHLFSSPVGYAAGYYSYKWAEVLEADAFTRFKKEGVMSPRVGREFREKILSKGNSKDPAELFRDFMGRDPDPEALLIRDGLA
jgi:oligopeptidase A